MEKDCFMKRQKKKENENLKLYLRNVSVLYDIFKNEKPIEENENIIFQYIKNMPMNEINKMVDAIKNRCCEFDLRDCFLNPILYKYMVLDYIQEIRTAENKKGKL